MDYEKKYKKALEYIKECVPDENGFITIYPQEIFPELKESEDEKIRKMVLKAFKLFAEKQAWVGHCLDDIDWDKCIAWLEKQGEHANFLSKIQVGDKVTRNQDGMLVNLSQLNRVAKKQGEQKPADKVEPKFHEGDWVVSDDKDVHDDYRVCKITKIDDGRYYIEGGDFLSESSLALYEYRPWTIQDAKDGDVLAYNDGSLTIFHYRLSDLDAGLYMSHILLTDKIEFKQTCAIGNVYPATKEQRDLLFQKMHEAGYMWDSESKQLLSLEAKPSGEKKNVWSEEDELHIRELESLVKRVWAIAEHENDKETIHKMSDLSFFLKTLKPQLKQEWRIV